MISFKSFIHAVHAAIMYASDSLMDKNVGLLDKYFEETTTEEKDVLGKVIAVKKSMSPKTVTLDYPNQNADGNIVVTHVQVPLITLVPISISQIEKATLTADFEMEIVNDTLQLHFADSNAKQKNGFFKKSKTNRGKLEIVISPQDTTDGLKLMIEGYEAILKRQIS